MLSAVLHKNIYIYDYSILSKSRKMGRERYSKEVVTMCFLCKGRIVPDTTTFMVDLGRCIIIVRNVPCDRCQQCGDTSYSNEVAKKLEQIVEKLKDSISEIAVTDYSSAA